MAERHDVIARLFSMLKQFVMWAPIMALITFVMSFLSAFGRYDKMLDDKDPISAIVSQKRKSAWPRFAWRRAGLIAAEYLSSPTISNRRASRTLLYAVSKVPDAVRLQLAAAEFITKDRPADADYIFKAIASRFVDDANAQRALMRVLTRLRGQRYVRERLNQLHRNEAVTKTVIRAQCLEDIGDYNNAKRLWDDLLTTGREDVSLAYAESLAMRGYLGKAIDILNTAHTPQAQRQAAMVQRRLDRASIDNDASLYVPGEIARRYYADIEKRRQHLPGAKHLKKIVLINASLGRGGAERQCINTALGLAQAHPEMSIEVWVRNLDERKSRNALLPELKQTNVKVRAIEMFSRSTHNLAKAWPQVDIRDIKEELHFLCPTLFQLYNGLKAHQPDVVHLWQDASIAMMNLAVLWADVPNICLSFRSLPPPAKGTDRPYYKPFMAGVANMPGVSLSANSITGGDAYADWLGLNPDRIKVISNALARPAEAISKATRQNDICIVTGLMRLDENKRPDIWVHIAAELAKRDKRINFRLIGDGPLALKIKHLIRELGLETRIEMLGAVSDIQKPLETSDILLHLARVEGLPNALLEAQAFGCAVIATDAGGAKEAFIPGETGLLLDNPENLDVQIIANTVYDLISDEARLRRFQKSAMEFASKNFSMDKMIALTLESYRHT